jgi:hypothetical protein
VTGLFVAATVVTLMQFMRVKDRRMLLLAAIFACQAQALGREWWDVWRDVYQAGACAAGLLLLLALSPRHGRHEPHPAGAGAAAPQSGTLQPAAPEPGASSPPPGQARR